ncbi:MAG: 23S rRNA (uracil(1939)-C(5))-methyltransferase RlmD [Eubacterium sp.]|nr:23S rRNA (uracil(1939)-C(5))-methyltransferase RlmD [Eubacterium sp.]
MEFRKNDTAVVRITDIGLDGEGIGKAEGFTLFVRDAVPGDLVSVRIMKAKKHYAYAKLLEVIEPSPDREKPPCSLAGPCGGCQLQSFSYEGQCIWKEQKVKNDLIRIGGIADPPMEPLVRMDDPFHYRNKAQFPIGRDREGRLIAGFFAAHSHRIVPLLRTSAGPEGDGFDTDISCLIGHDKNNLILKEILCWMKQFHISAYDEEFHRGVVRHVLIRCGYYTDEVLVCLVINANQLSRSRELSGRLAALDCGIVSISYSVNRNQTNVIMGESCQVIWGREYMMDCLEDVQFAVSPLSFYQVNPRQTERLYRKVLECARLTGKETVFDLYCGIGTISLFLARHARTVYGVEIVPQAIGDARRNAALNGIQNAEFFVGKAEEVIPRLIVERNLRADVVVVDPPRKGCDAQLLETIAQISPARVIYVSCNPSTLARDLSVLCNKGYRLELAQPFDQFSMGVHVECVCCLRKAG